MKKVIETVINKSAAILSYNTPVINIYRVLVAMTTGIFLSLLGAAQKKILSTQNLWFDLKTL